MLSDEIHSLNSLTRTSHPGLIFRASWSKTIGFEVELSTLAETCITFGNGMKTTPIALRLQTQPAVRLIVSAGFSVPLAESEKPLIFTVTFDAGMEGASATGEMSGWWVNPCNVGRNVKVGPNLALDIEIIYAQFVSTGTPRYVLPNPLSPRFFWLNFSSSGFGLRGGIMIGQTEAQCAMQISEDPTRKLDPYCRPSLLL